MNPEISKIKTFIVDSFTNEVFKGNPAGVCLLDDEISEELMLSIAKELNFSETAFVRKIDGELNYSIRYFSPKMEIPLCGHATLASAKILFEESQLTELHFFTIQNIDLFIQKSGTDIIMEFPIYKTVPSDVPKNLLDALGLSVIINCEYNKETNILLLEISDADYLSNLTPDFNALYQSHDSINGVLVTAQSNNDKYDFYSRYFWPWSGTNEDPVTGGTHTFLAPYWGKRLNKSIMKSFQSSARTGFMEVELLTESSFLIKGQAVIVFDGIFTF